MAGKIKKIQWDYIKNIEKKEKRYWKDWSQEINSFPLFKYRNNETDEKKITGMFRWTSSRKDRKKNSGVDKDTVTD